MKFDGIVTKVETDRGYGNDADRLRIEIDLDEGIGKERAIFGLRLPKDHPAALEFLAAWQAGRRIVVAANLA